LSDFSATMIYQDIIEDFHLPTNIPLLRLSRQEKGGEKRKERADVTRLKIIKSDLNTV